MFAPSVDEMYPPGFQTLGRRRGGVARARGRRAAGSLPRRRDRLPEAVRDRPAGARVLRPEGRAAGASSCAGSSRDLSFRSRSESCRRCATPDRLALSSRNVLLSSEERERARALPQALDAGAHAYADGERSGRRDRARALNGLTPDYVELLDLDGALVLATAVRVGSIRLIDNVVLKGDIS